MIKTTRKKAVPILAGVLSLSLIGGVLGISEAYTRYRETHRSNVPGTMPHLYYQHSRLGVAMVRDFDYFGWAHVNRQGFRGPEVSIEKPSGVFRVLVLGGSTTFDIAVRGDENTWPARFEDRLNELDAAGEYEVVNGGTAGYTVFDNFIRLQRELLPLEPDVVIVYHAHNDIFKAMGTVEQVWSPRPQQVEHTSRWGRWLLEHSLLYAKVRERIKLQGFGRSQQSTSHPPFEERLAEGLEAFETDLTSFVAILFAHDLRVVLPIVVRASVKDDPDLTRYWADAIPFATPDQVAIAYDAYNEVIRRVGLKWGLEVVETETYELGEQTYYADDDPIHFNNAGAERMGRSMGDAVMELIRNGAFDPPLESAANPG